MVALALGKSLFEQGSQRVGRPEPKKPTNLCDLRPRNEKRPAVDLSTPGVKSFGRQSSNSDERISSETLFATTSSSPDNRHRRRFRMHPVAFCGHGNPSTFAPYPAPEMPHQPSVLTSGHRRFETFSPSTTMESAVPHFGSQLFASSFSAHPSNAPLLSTSPHFAPCCRSLLFRLPTVATSQTRDNEYRTQADLHPAWLLHYGCRAK